MAVYEKIIRDDNGITKECKSRMYADLPIVVIHYTYDPDDYIFRYVDATNFDEIIKKINKNPRWEYWEK